MKLKLLEKGKIGNVEIRNRMVMPPMAVGFGGPDRLVNERIIAYFEARAAGGVGLITSSAFAIDEDLAGFVEGGQSSLVREGAEKGLKEMIDRVHKHDAKISIQLLHPGRQTFSALNQGQQPVAPSALSEVDYLDFPREITLDEIHDLQKKFIAGAKMAYDCGADGVELHGAHGYLIYQFMADRANQRTDDYGGSFENRMRFVRELVEGINAIKPENGFLSIRINGTDGFEGGMTIEEGVRIAQYLEKLGVDAINISRATYSNQFDISEPAPFEEGCRTDMIRKVKEAVSIPVIAVNNIKRLAAAEQMLEDGIADFVGVGRGLLADPEFINKAADGKTDRIQNCIACCNCLDSIQVGAGAAECSVNPKLGKEYLYNDDTIRKDGGGRKVVIIGGGPGGMQAAITAAERGFSVTLLEKDSALGGSMILGSKGTGKDKVASTVEAMINRMKDLKVQIKLDTEVKSAYDVLRYEPYAVVAAVGGRPIKPPIPGLDGDNVYLAHDILRDEVIPEDMTIALVGSGMTGLEAAEVLAEGNNKIIMYDMLDEIAKGANLSTKFAIMTALGGKGTEFKTLHKLIRVRGDDVIFEDMSNDNEEVTQKADMVVLSLGVSPEKSIGEMLDGKVDKLITVGDCGDGKKIVDATREGFLSMWEL